MTAVVDAPLGGPPALRRAADVRLALASALLWRVVDRTGRVIGHLEAYSAGGGVRYRARRFHSGSRAFRDLGDFWSADDAVECLRYAR